MKGPDKAENDLLGICIPTFNRASYLEKCLCSITEDFKNFGFPIYISDNFSTDNTKYVIERYQKMYDNIFYIKNDSNMGPYLNILNVIKMAKSRYIWLMGDDDAILPESVEKILAKISEGNDYVVGNSIPYDKNLTRKKFDKIIECDDDRKYAEGETLNLLRDLKKWTYHGFMSSMIIRRDLVNPIIEKYYDPHFPLYANNWVPMALFYEAIVNRRGTFICEPVIKKRRDNLRTSGTDFWSYTFLDHLKVMDYLKNNKYPFLDIRDFLNLRDIVYAVIVSKHKDPNIILFSSFIKKTEFFSFQLKLLLILFDKIPRFGINILYSIIKVLFAET